MSIVSKSPEFRRLADELAEARRTAPEPTRAELIADARFMATHPDTGAGIKRVLKALLDEIDEHDKRIDVAIRYAGRLLKILNQ